MDELFEQMQSNEVFGEHSIYNEVAPLYDLVYNNHYDYDYNKEIIENEINQTGTDILECACGTGEILERLEDKHNCTGLDMNRGMLDIAQSKTKDSEVVLGDARDTPFIKNSYEISLLLGNAAAHLIKDKDMKAFISEMSRVTNKNGVILIDFLSLSDWKTPHTSKKIFNTDDYIIKRNTTSVPLTEKTADLHMIFEVIRKHDNETAMVGIREKTRTFEKEQLKRMLMNNGFNHVTEKPHKHRSKSFLIGKK